MTGYLKLAGDERPSERGRIAVNSQVGHRRDHVRHWTATGVQTRRQSRCIGRRWLWLQNERATAMSASLRIAVRWLCRRKRRLPSWAIRNGRDASPTFTARLSTRHSSHPFLSFPPPSPSPPSINPCLLYPSCPSIISANATNLQARAISSPSGTSLTSPSARPCARSSRPSTSSASTASTTKPSPPRRSSSPAAARSPSSPFPKTRPTP